MITQMKYILFILLSALISASLTFFVLTRLRQKERITSVTSAIFVVPPDAVPTATGYPSPIPSPTAPDQQSAWPEHKDITATVFWIGEDASEDNGNIPNRSSAWDSQWLEHYGGTDTPYTRLGYYPKDFVPMENPFYVALPYDDMSDSGRKESAAAIYWNPGGYPNSWSLLKNRWVRVTYKGHTCFGQWEDVGPYNTDDISYVFGNDPPDNPQSGIDLSPAMRTCLKLAVPDSVTWRFVPDSEVPPGPWKEIVTTRQVSW